MSDTLDPIEVTTRYATRVATLADAWAFVMERVDLVGPDPRIEITPSWIIYADPTDERDGVRVFSVVVDGMVPEGEPKETTT